MDLLHKFLTQQGGYIQEIKNVTNPQKEKKKKRKKIHSAMQNFHKSLKVGVQALAA
jgi:hypothetical protein